ncbi:unnamed protein product [Somion occarium]|uniref:Protein kinase domain-containing protein n=1 Tax=Somion occarium TaxID=3059160 RepID=A0ABP1CIJ7_9APHY
MGCVVRTTTQRRSPITAPLELVGKARYFVIERFRKRKKSPNLTKFQVSSAIPVSGEHVDELSAGLSSQVDDHTDVLRLIAEDIQGEGHCQELVALRGLSAQRALELMQELLDDGPVWRSFSVGSSLENRRRIYDSMLYLSRCSQQMPSSIFVTVQRIPADMPKCGGLNSDIYLGVYSGKTVAVRRIRSHQWQTDSAGWEATKARLFYECLKWRQLRHPNVLPLFGIDTSFPNTPALIQPWLENGNIRQYMSRLERKPEVSVLIQWLIDIARGMAYLHELNIPHGDLRGSNVLISDDKVAQVADVVLFPFREEWTIGIKPQDGTKRWMAPEFSDSMPPSYSADIYAFGSVSVEEKCHFLSQWICMQE